MESNWNCFATGIDNAETVATIKCLEPLFGNIITVAATVAGVALFMWLIIGGFKYLTSGGDPKKLEEAKHTLTYAFLGFVLIVSAYIILNIIATFFGDTIGDKLRMFEVTFPEFK